MKFLFAISDENIFNAVARRSKFFKTRQIYFCCRIFRLDKKKRYFSRISPISKRIRLISCKFQQKRFTCAGSIRGAHWHGLSSAELNVLKGFNDLRKVWSNERDLQRGTTERGPSRGTLNFGGKPKGAVGRVSAIADGTVVPWSNRPFHFQPPRSSAGAVTAANSIYQVRLIFSWAQSYIILEAWSG